MLPQGVTFVFYYEISNIAQITPTNIKHFTVERTTHRQLLFPEFLQLYTTIMSDNIDLTLVWCITRLLSGHSALQHGLDTCMQTPSQCYNSTNQSVNFGPFRQYQNNVFFLWKGPRLSDCSTNYTLSYRYMLITETVYRCDSGVTLVWRITFTCQVLLLACLGIIAKSEWFRWRGCAGEEEK